VAGAGEADVLAVDRRINDRGIAVGTSSTTLNSEAYSQAVFWVNGIGFAIAALTALAPRYPGLARFYERHGRKIVIADMQVTMVALAFLWLAVIRII
jgi:hypothetical protein